MKIFAYKQPTALRLTENEYSLTISPYESALSCTWDDVDPGDADYIMVPFIFKAQLPTTVRDNDFYLGGDITLPLISTDPSTGQELARPELRATIVRSFLSAFPHYDRYPEKHIFIDNGDVDSPCPILSDSILFKVNASCRHPAILPIPHPTPDPGVPRPIGDADLDISFQGRLTTHPVRDRLASWSKRTTALSIEFRETDKSFYRMETAERSEMARQAFDLMLRSRFVLSPRGRGTSSRRFYEILAHGRIPVCISDAVKLPLENVLDYDSFMVRVPEGYIGWTGDYVRAFELEHDLHEASRLARRAYSEYFSPKSFRHFIETSLAHQAQVV